MSARPSTGPLALAPTLVQGLHHAHPRRRAAGSHQRKTLLAQYGIHKLMHRSPRSRRQFRPGLFAIRALDLLAAIENNRAVGSTGIHKKCLLSSEDRGMIRLPGAGFRENCFGIFTDRRLE